jgi:DNA-binding response OmpR family regulator
LSSVLLLTSGHESPAEILPSLTLLPHAVRTGPAVAATVSAGPLPDAVLVDARRDLVAAKRLLQALRGAEVKAPLLAIVTEGGWAALAADWGADDVVLHTAGPGEVEARLRLCLGRAAGPVPEQSGEIRSGELVINEATYSARMNGRSLNLTFKEFELLKFLTQQPGRVFTRAQLLQEVWGYDYFGGTRTVDVHVRRLRAKLGPENEALIGTVRNVGYRFVPARGGAGRPDGDDPGGDGADEDGADQDSTGQDSTGQDSALPDSALRDSADHDGTGGDGTGGDNAGQAGAGANGGGPVTAARGAARSFRGAAPAGRGLPRGPGRTGTAYVDR